MREDRFAAAMLAVRDEIDNLPGAWEQRERLRARIFGETMTQFVILSGSATYSQHPADCDVWVSQDIAEATIREIVACHVDINLNLPLDIHRVEPESYVHTAIVDIPFYPGDLSEPVVLWSDGPVTIRRCLKKTGPALMRAWTHGAAGHPVEWSSEAWTVEIGGRTPRPVEVYAGDGLRAWRSAARQCAQRHTAQPMAVPFLDFCASLSLEQIDQIERGAAKAQRDRDVYPLTAEIWKSSPHAAGEALVMTRHADGWRSAYQRPDEIGRSSAMTDDEFVRLMTLWLDLGA